ncbi:MAG: phosphatase PAP2 family protein [Myxococcales bacterium]
MKRALAHCRSLWPRWPLLPALPMPLYSALVALQGQLRWDHLAMTAIVLTLAYAHRRTKQLLLAFVGFPLVAVVYDAARFIRDWGVTEPRVLGCGLQRFERTWFGLWDGGLRVTMQDYFLAHHHPAADLFFAAPYAVFLAVPLAFAVYLFVRDPRACARFSWGFFALNVLGMLTYHALPATPPWYLHRYGCAIHLGATEFEGAALARVDAMTGLSYFHAFYGRASEVFGALPSLHVAFPLLIVLEGWQRQRWPFRAASLFFFAWMCCAAVYLDHHWIADLALGCVYAVGVFAALRRLMPARAWSQNSSSAPAPRLAGFLRKEGAVD